MGNQATKSLTLVSLPVGPEPVRTFLDEWCLNQGASVLSEGVQVVVMGLCGSLSPHLNVGDVVMYERCLNGNASPTDEPIICSTDVSLPSDSQWISTVTSVTGVTCDRVLSCVDDKRQASHTFKAQVVDMEGFAVLKSLCEHVEKISILRVISDGAEHNLPDLSDAFDVDGNIRSAIMVRQFLRHPAGAIRLIQGSLAALKVLSHLSRTFAHGLENEYLGGVTDIRISNRKNQGKTEI